MRLPVSLRRDPAPGTRAAGFSAPGQRGREHDQPPCCFSPRDGESGRLVPVQSRAGVSRLMWYQVTAVATLAICSAAHAQTVEDARQQMLAPQPTLTESQKNDLRLEAGRLESSARNYYVVGGSLIGLGILGAGVTFWVDYDSN